MCKYIKVIFAKFSLVCIFLTSLWTLNGFKTLIEWLHDTFSKLYCVIQHGSDVYSMFTSCW